MESKSRGFIVSHYTTGNGTKLTRDEVGERILNLLGGSALTCGDIARTLKLPKECIYNVIAHMIQTRVLAKAKNDKGIYEYYKIKDCLLAQLFYPSPEDVEKQFKIKSRQFHKAEQGRSISYGSKGILPYQSSYLTSPLWDM